MNTTRQVTLHLNTRLLHHHCHRRHYHHQPPAHPPPPTPPDPPPALTLSHPILSKLETCVTAAQFRQIHAHTITTGIFTNTFAASRLLKASAFSLNPPDLAVSALIFSQIQNPDVFSYNLMIKAQSKTSNPLYSIWFYRRMLTAHEGQRLFPNEYTFCFLLDCCSSRGSSDQWEGRQVHCHLFKHGLDHGVFAYTSLVNMYGNCGAVHDAQRAFDEMPQRTDVSWGAMINAYLEHGYVIEGLRLFTKMRRVGFEPTNAMLVRVLCACREAGDLAAGRALHAFVEVCGVDLNVTLGTSLVDMYAKCGCVDMARQVFYTMPTKSVASWNCMINGLAMNGHGVAALSTFKEMQKLGLQPNASTFVGVLNACSHAGLVENGMKFFSSMSRVHGVEPNLKHYGCMVDLYGRAGRIREAVEMIRVMPVTPDSLIWGALLGACKIHDHRRLGEATGAQLIKMLPHDGYLLLSDAYALSRRWDDVASVRKVMADTSIRKVPGRSSITK